MILRTKGLPKARSKTPIAILTRVVKAIQDEPLRYDQGEWAGQCILGDAEDKPLWWSVTGTIPAIWPRAPVCNTVGCVAGWVVIVARANDQPMRLGFFTIENRARRVLGLSEAQAQRLFSPEAVRSTLRPGTRAYVRAGVRHIERFMREELDYKKPRKAATR